MISDLEDEVAEDSQLEKQQEKRTLPSKNENS